VSNADNRANVALTSSEQELRLVVETIPALVWKAGPDGRIEYLNTRALEYIGAPLGEIIGWGWMEKVHPDDIAFKVKNWLENLESGNPHDAVCRIRGADGRYRWFEVRGEPLRASDGTVQGWYGVLIDIDDRTKAENALRESESKLRQIIDTVPGLIWSTGPDGEPTHVSQRLVDYSGMRFEDFKHLGWKAFVHPDDFPETVKAYYHAIQSGTSYQDVMRLRRADGEYRWHHARCEPLRDRQGRIIQRYGLSVDIDEAKKAEEQPRSAAQLQATLNVIPAYTWYAAPSGGLTFVNKRTADYLGLPKDHSLRFGIEVGAQWDAHVAMLHPDDREESRRAWSTCLRTGEADEFSQRVRNAQGDYRWFLSRVEPLRASDGTLLQWLGVNVDIEELKCAEQALRESEAKVRDYAETASDWFWEIGPDYKFTLLTENAFGSDPAARIGTACWDHALDLETEPEKWRLVRATLAARKPFRDFVYCSKDSNGSPIHVRASGKPVFDSSGEFRGYRGTGADVTAITRAQHAEALLQRELQRSQFYLSEGQRLTHMGSWAMNPSGFFDHWSHELFQMYGLDPHKRAPTLEQYLALVHPQDRDFMAETIRRMRARRCGCDVKKRIIRPDGELRYIRCVGIPVIEDDVLKGFLGTAMDVTEQELLTRELERRQAYLAEAQKLTHTGSFVWDIGTGTAEYLSDEWYSIYGFERGDEHAWETRLERLHADDRNKWQAAVDRAIAEKSDYDLEKRIVLPNGETRYLHALGHPVLNSAGEAVQFMGTVTDITERKRAQQEHERLRELEADLAHLNRLSIMGELAASLAHEIKQPIGAARNNARAALNFLDRRPPDIGEVKEALDCVVGDTDRAGQIVDRILDHIKKEPPRTDIFDVNEAVSEVIALARIEAAGNGVSVQTGFTEGLSPVEGDRVQVQQVALNLILNAVEAMSSVVEGPRELLISTERRPGGGVVIAVRDSGPGIDPEHLERVFEAFYTTKSGGLGMGLSICRSIIDVHGGRLWATANQPRGAVFQFTLPGAASAL
jgi:PAS domain S-box-containing protein